MRLRLAGDDLVRLYDFFSPFYAYARRAAHNALMDVLARLPHNDADEMILALTAVIDSPSAEGIDAEIDAARFALRIDFERMLAMVDNELPERQHQVVRLTLALRPQFKRALLLILGVVADDFPELVRGASIDQAIASALTRQRPEKPANENDVRVLRFHAKKKITTLDAVLGALLTRFLEA
ncbi:MAG: hypothetical protein IPK16_28165 [Anaerolineales bacterium]|nr:hypothetical protein [Anaerolineales bacterium]